MKQSLQKQKDGSNSGDHSKFDPLLYFPCWWIRLLFCHSCPVLAKSRTEHVTGSPPNPPTLQLTLVAKNC